MGRHNDKSIKEVLNDLMASNGRIAKGFFTAQIEEVWKKEMGPVIAGYTTKVYFKEGILKIYLSSSPLKKELMMGKPKIIKIINDALKQELVTEVEIF